MELTNWHLAGGGTPHDDCGRPQAYHEWPDGSRVWGPQQCGRRQCPRCTDQRYLIDAADDITRTLMSWIMDKLAKQKLYDEKGRSLKVYHYIYSRRENDNNLKQSRRSCSAYLRSCGMVSGYSILHPWRGSHGKKATPLECRSSMDRSHLSIHFHGIALGYWSERQEGNEYYKSKVLLDIRSFADTDMAVVLRTRLLKELQYDIGHAGWFGEKGQSISSWGDRSTDEKLIPPRPDIYLAHPNLVGLDGEPVWCKRTKPPPETWEDLECEIQICTGNRGDLQRDIEHIQRSMPHSGSTGTSLFPWWHIDEIKREEWHLNWYPWRKLASEAVLHLIRS